MRTDNVSFNFNPDTEFRESEVVSDCVNRVRSDKREKG